MKILPMCKYIENLSCGSTLTHQPYFGAYGEEGDIMCIIRFSKQSIEFSVHVIIFVYFYTRLLTTDVARTGQR